MPARNPEHQRAACRVAILARWRADDDPELAEARRHLAVTRAQAHLIEAAEALALAGSQQPRDPAAVKP
jgi:hypothetical protein